jgi:hypothetical protein
VSVPSAGSMELELTEMPSCNLAEMVHNKWLQQSGNQGTDLYIAIVDDFVRGTHTSCQILPISEG